MIASDSELKQGLENVIKNGLLPFFIGNNQLMLICAIYFVFFLDVFQTVFGMQASLFVHPFFYWFPFFCLCVHQFHHS